MKTLPHDEQTTPNHSQKAPREVQKKAAKRPNKFIPELKSLGLTIIFVLGTGYVLLNPAIPLYLRTSIATIFGGGIVFVIGQIIQKAYIEPLQDLQKTIGDIGSALLIYGNTAENVIGMERQQEARIAFRKLAGDLMGKRRLIPNYVFFANSGWMPSHADLKEASQNLIGLSNSVGANSYECFQKCSEAVKKALWLDI